MRWNIRNMASPYDQVEYPSFAQPQSHPDRLATLGTLFGLEPAGEACRVLEIGCGDGLNLISIAVAMPQSRSVGIDLAEAPIRRGAALIEYLGLTNVTLRQMNLLDAGDDLGEFDYIIAHGLYSWVPQQVRDKLLDVCRRTLTPQGVAYISFNSLPGGHLRQMCRRMMRYRIRNLSDSPQRVAEARKFLQLLYKAHQKDHPVAMLLKAEIERISPLPDGQVFHDDLADINEPVYFDEFVAHAGAHALQFLAEAELELIGPEGLPEWVQTELAQLAGDDIVAREMYMDFLRDRTFRQTLVCHANAKLTRPPAPQNVRRLQVASSARPVSGHPEIHTEKLETFKAPNHAQVSTNNPLAKAAMVVLSELWPQAIAFDELVGRSKSRAKVQVNDFDANHLGGIFLKLCAGGLVEFHSRQRAIVRAPAQRPLASPLARMQAEGSGLITTLDGDSIQLKDPAARRLLTLLDGTRDRGTLVEELLALTKLTPQKLEVQIEAHLVSLGRMGLLVE